MKTVLKTVVLTTILLNGHGYDVNYKYSQDKKLIRKYIKKHTEVKSICQYYKTIHIESKGRYDAVSINDLGKPAYGFIQFRGRYAKILEKKLGFTKRTSLYTIKRKLCSSKGIKLQKKLFNKKFILPIKKFTQQKHITNPKVIEILVDWKVNGMPKRYNKYINKHTTVKDIIKLRKRYYILLHRCNPKKYTRKLYIAWIKRLNKFI